MTTTTHYTAPWGKLLWGFTILGAGVLGAATVATAPVSLPLSLLFGGTIAICAGGAVRGYRIEGDTLIIERLGRDKRVSLKGLSGVRHGKDLMDGAIRVGNGGLFVFSGFYRTPELGWFRLHGNDILGRAVVFVVDGKKWMVTPDNPEAFVAELEKRIR